MKNLQRHLRDRLRSSFSNAPMDRDLDAEMSSHLEFAIEENMKGGMSAEEARRQALVRFGGVEQAKEKYREARGWPMLDILLQDLRFTLRTLRRDSGFTVVAVLILALGIGANIVVFSVVNTILLRPLPFRDPQQLVWLAGNKGVGGLSSTTYWVDAYAEIQRNNRSFQEMTAFVPFYAVSESKLVGRGESKSVAGVWVAENFFQTLGVKPALGRFFLPEETVKGGRQPLVLSYGFWQRQFNADPSIVGQAIQLNNDTITVVGVLPSSFDFGSVFAPGMKVDYFSPAVMENMKTWGHVVSIVGRLRPGVTVEQAQAEANVTLPQLKEAGNPDWGTDINTTITGLKEHVSGQLRSSLIVLWCAVGLIMLIVCVNLSNLMLARTAARSMEFAMRSALGAGRGRLIRQLLTESLVLSGVGAVFGLGFAFAALSYLAHQGSIALPLLSSVRVDQSALLWTLFVAVSAGILFGTAPSLRMAGANLQDTLKDSGHGIRGGRKRDRLRSALVISEVALACVLLVGAGLLLRSFLRVLDVDLGFEPTHAAALKADYNDGGKLENRGPILHEMLGRVTSIPGIEAAGITDMLPLDRNRSWGLSAKGQPYSKDRDYSVFVYLVSPGYLAAMGMHLREGRDFSWRDTPSNEPVIIINEAAARREWPGQDAVGKLVQGIGKGDTRVIGVFSDVRESSVESASSPEVLVPMTQNPDTEGAELVVRSKLPLEAIAGSVLRTLRSINPGQPASEFRPIQQLVDHAISPRRFFVMLVGIFAALGLILASLGIYGVISYSVTTQTQEIGIRMALGATAGRVQMGVISKTLGMALIGIAVGTVASFIVARVIASLLFATDPTDPPTFFGMVLVLGTVSSIAGYIPARRASRIHPMVALRSN